MKRVTGPVLVGVSGLLTALTLSGCSTAYPGQAAVVGDTRIAESTIADQVRSLNEAAGRPADAPSMQATRTLVSYNVGYELLDQTAEALEVKVTQSQLDTVYAQQVQSLGGESQLQQAAAQQGIPPVNLRRDLRSQLLAQAISSSLTDDQNAAQQALIAAVQEVTSGITIEVAPKYGVWDAEQLQLVTDPDPVATTAADPSAGVADPAQPPTQPDPTQPDPAQPSPPQ